MAAAFRSTLHAASLAALLCLTSCSHRGEPKAEQAQPAAGPSSTNAAAAPAPAPSPAPPKPIPPILEKAVDRLKPGEFVWQPEASPNGPVLIVVSVAEQRAHVYRNGVAIGVSTVSTGRKGHATPTGVFTILERQEKHFSNKYNNAPMPYMERLTWDGVALHAGNLPGYPASHGCVRLPKEFAKRLFSVTQKGITVVIADRDHAETSVSNPGLLAPVNPKADGAGSLSQLRDLDYAWVPERSPTGPLSILVSSADNRAFVYRNGIEIGRAKVIIADPERPLGRSVFTMLDGYTNDPNLYVPGQPSHKWMRVQVAGDSNDTPFWTMAARVKLPPAFAAAVYPLLQPGTTIHVTDLAASGRSRTDPGFVILATDGAAGGQ